MTSGDPRYEALLRPMQTTTWRWWAAALPLTLVVLAAAYAWATQILYGLEVTGLDDPTFWGLYLTNYVFWIGISHAGTLISAILRLTKSEWRRPVTRCAEAITVFALVIGPAFAIIHMGRPWYFYRCFPLPDGRGVWPNFRSPIVWDVVAITTYLVGSLLYLYLPMIPDAAQLRDRVSGWRRPLYRLLALGWRGTARQWDRLERAISVMAVVILLVAVSVHTVVSYVFGMSIVPTWHSTIFGPYFVVGAIFSGIAMLLVAMAIMRKALSLESWLEPLHFDYLSRLLLVMCLVWAWFIGSEHLTTWYGNQPAEAAILHAKDAGAHAPLFWAMVACCFVIPVPLLAFSKVRQTPWLVGLISAGVTVGMYLERFLIIVPALERPRLAAAWGGAYSPSPVELAITAGTFATFTLLYMVFAKIFPVVAIWEVAAEEGS